MVGSKFRRDNPFGRTLVDLAQISIILAGAVFVLGGIYGYFEWLIPRYLRLGDIPLFLFFLPFGVTFLFLFFVMETLDCFDM